MKILKALIILIGIFPLILNAEEDKEVKWKWYTLVEENVHFEKDAEQICEYFETLDKEVFMYGDWVYSLTKPEIKENREIVKEFKELHLDRSTTNMIKITRFDLELFSDIVYLKELEIFNKDKKVDYTIGVPIPSDDSKKLKDEDLETGIEAQMYTSFIIMLEEPMDIKDITLVLKYLKNDNFKALEFYSYLSEDIFTNAYASYGTDKIIDCTEEICTLKIKVEPDSMNQEELIINTPIYKYRDKYYKCYTNKKLYIPGYYKELDGFIKDESDFIEELKETSAIVEPLPFVQSDIKEEKQEETKIEEIEVNKEDNKQISLLTKEKNNKNNNKDNYISIYIISLIVFIFITLLFIAKKIKKCRTK